MLTDEQKEIRKLGIGGSEIGAVAGLSPYAGPIDVWRAKVEGYSLEETKPMKRGRILEPALADWYAEDTGALLEVAPTLRHPTSAVALATPDRFASLAGERWVLELKTANFRTLHQWGEAGTDEVPQHYLAQVAWEMACADLERADLAVLIAGDDFRVYRIQRDREMEAMLLEEAERFWKDYVLTRTPPPIDGSASCADWLAEKYPTHRAPLLEATPEAEHLALELRRARDTGERWESEAQQLRNQLQALIGDAEGVTGSFGRITWKQSKGRTVIDWEAVAKAAGASSDLIKQFTTTKPGPRVFRPTWKEQ